MAITIYHNPRCSKSRQALALLQEKNIEPTVIEYLKTPPTKAQFKSILQSLNVPAKALLRTKETRFKELNIKPNELSESELITIMLENPILIERPIVINDKQAVVARPPEKVADILI